MMNDPVEMMRATRDLTSTWHEKRRQAAGRAALADVMGEPRLANLRPCSICGLLDETDPCGDHTRRTDGST